MDAFTFDKEYDSVNKTKYLNGLTSTTLNREVALDFTLCNDNSSITDMAANIHILLEIEILGSL